MSKERNAYPTYSVFAVLPRPADVLGGERKSYWAPIGAAWENADKSISLKLELIPTSPGVTIQLRPYEKPKNSEKRSQEQEG